MSFSHQPFGFASSSGDNNVKVFDLAANKLLKKIPAGDGPDAILYDAKLHPIYVSEHEVKSGNIIDPTTLTSVASIPLGGEPEYSQADPESGLAVLRKVNVLLRNERLVDKARVSSSRSVSRHDFRMHKHAAAIPPIRYDRCLLSNAAAQTASAVFLPHYRFAPREDIRETARKTLSCLS